ncbi:acetyl-CoA decarbonylase/synthase complex subunit beta [Methanimicrococcus blatticola]|uniref:CO-methylating acetyl-CoA synthase n=1 Tax=Methanimicrococcus blatticola TaxID=91560 RepID=A0A484F452_9EURY|nr:acetyl-CoA decarbonylase/synthase complex subunit beta [Methanimicrococcus blatticola]MBZ3935643.1 acetyl-CoA decarbonylase/synthase complex subunit beta [Methanimicrococcus blatticola]MCC2509285.1 acetyl-CoA decarbonylase/synthase complex subunit beta [Methanimicrococcus blatticola]TDQ69351.1 acetyl-CoA decarbonylase/synthase beta subunit [Methanimicrococcus blatticola]
MNHDEKINAAPQTAGEHIRDDDIFVVLGGVEDGYQLVTAADPVADTGGSSRKADSFDEYLIGPELEELGKTSPFGLVIRIGIKDDVKAAVSEKDLEAVVEKKLGDILNLISGVSHEQTRDQIEIKISVDAVKNGVTFEKIESFVREQLMEEFPFIESAAVRIYTDKEAVKAGLEIARRVYEKRDERALSIHDDEADKFYGCKICQISSPAHVCVITPDRPSVCGTINWFEAGASALANPDGHVFEIEKGELLDEAGGEYAGVNSALAVGSGGENERVLLYSLIENPHTTGSVFEIIAFYIPEMNGIGLIDRTTKTPSVNCLTFEEMMIFTGYGQQISGFSGVGEMYLLSDKFMQKEGGWDNVVWMSRSLKDKLIQKIGMMESGGPRYEKLLGRIRLIPTENDAENLNALADYWNRHE